MDMGQMNLEDLFDELLGQEKKVDEKKTPKKTTVSKSKKETGKKPQAKLPVSISLPVKNLQLRKLDIKTIQ